MSWCGWPRSQLDSPLRLWKRFAALSVQLPELFPKDPADRLITATALAEPARLVTADRAIRASGIADTIW